MAEKKFNIFRKGKLISTATFPEKQIPLLRKKFASKGITILKLKAKKLI